jgi:hypothetical protein
MLTIKKDRIIVHDKDIGDLDVRGCRGRHYKNMKGGPGWSFPLEEMDRLRRILNGYKDDIEDYWYNIFPEYKFLRKI